MKLLLSTLLLLASPLGPVTAFADDLPGVEPQKPIVQPLPEPNGDRVETTEDGYVKIGDWDVKVSGSIIVDVGVGKIAPQKR